MKLRVNDQVMYEGEMMRVRSIDKHDNIIIDMVDDELDIIVFGPFSKDEYKEWPVL